MIHYHKLWDTMGATPLCEEPCFKGRRNNLLINNTSADMRSLTIFTRLLQRHTPLRKDDHFLIFMSASSILPLYLRMTVFREIRLELAGQQ